MFILFKKGLLFSLIIFTNNITSFNDVKNLTEIVPYVLKRYEQLEVSIDFLDQIKHKFGKIGDDQKQSSSLQGWSDTELDFLAHEFCKITENTHLVIIWPKAIQDFEYIISEINNFGKVIYTKNVTLKNKALSYLIKNIPEKADNIAFHLEQYFNNQNSGNVIAVLCTFPNLADAVTCKQIIREKLKLTPRMSALHIADTQDQSIMLAQILFNQNSVSYLNNELNFPEFKKFNFLFKKYKQVINNLEIDQDCCCVDGSSILAMYGIRDINIDFDFLSSFQELNIPQILYETNDGTKLGPLDVHNQAWLNANVNPIETIFDPNYYFYYEGFKFTTLERIRLFKFNQNREIDIRDVEKIDKILNAFF